MFVNVIVLVFFIFLKFIFSACDSAFAYVNKYVILQKAKSGDKKSISIKKLLQNKSKMFGTIKVAITLIEFFMSAYAAEAFISWIKYYVSALVVEYDIVTNVSMVILTFILSYFSIVFGDIIPKRIGMNFPEKTLNRLIYPLLIVSFLIRPFEFILEKTTDLFCKIFGILQESGPETRSFHALPRPVEYIDIRIGRMDEGTEGSATVLEVQFGIEEQLYLGIICHYYHGRIQLI